MMRTFRGAPGALVKLIVALGYSSAQAIYEATEEEMISDVLPEAKKAEVPAEGRYIGGNIWEASKDTGRAVKCRERAESGHQIE